MKVPEILSKPATYGYLSISLTATFMLCLILPFWMHINGDRDVGAFESKYMNKSTMFQTECTGSMSEAECGYLKSLQISAVITVLFGIFSSYIYFLPPHTFSALPVFLATSGSLLTTIFALMTLVLFAYFEKTYWTDDGINREYPGPGADSTYLFVMFWIWMIGLLLSSFGTIGSYFLIYNTAYKRKGMITLND